MADKIKFLYGSTADINTPSSSNYPAVVRGQVYFAVDQLTSSAANGQIYFDVPVGTGTEAKRVLMSNRAAFATNASTATYASTANRAQNDAGGHSITNLYLSTAVTLSDHTLTFKDGNNNTVKTLTLPDNDEKLKVASIASTGTKIYLLGNTSTSLGSGNNTITSTAVTFRNIYIDTDGYLKGNIKSKELTFPGGTYYDGTKDVNVGNTIHYLEGTGTATTVVNHSVGTSTGSGVYSARWGAIDTNDAITTLYSGLTIAYKIPVAGNGSYNNVLRITKADGTAITNPLNTSANDGYYPVVLNDSSWITSRYPVGSILILVFDANKVITDHRPVNSSTMSITGCWKMVDYDSTNIYQLKEGYNGYITSSAVYRYQFVLTQNETTVTPVNAVNNSTATNKTLTTALFDPYGPIFYHNSTSTKNANAAIGDSFYEQILADLKYSFNTGNTLTARKAVYLVTSMPNDDGKVSLDTTPIVQDLPTANINKLYIYLGQAYDNYRIELVPYHPVYSFQNGRLQQTAGQSLYANTATHAIYDSIESSVPIKDKYVANIYLSTGDKPRLKADNGNGDNVLNIPWLNIDSTSGIIDLKHIPQAALERVTVVANTAAMFALTTATVQNGDVIKVNDQGTMYFVKDDTKLDQSDGYEEFAVGTAGAVAWANVTGKPGLLSTASTAVLTTSGSNAVIKIKWEDFNGNTSTSTLTIPAAATNVAGLVSTGTQTFAGAKTFNTTATFSNRLNYSGIQSVSDNATYHLWMATAATATKGVPVYSTALSYNPSTNILNVIASQATYDGVSTATAIANKYMLYDEAAFSTATNAWTIKNGAGDYKTFQIQNWYPSSATWAANSTSVTLTIRNRSQHSTALISSAVSGTIPAATTSSAGIVTSSAQTFGGVKTFNDGLVIYSAAQLKSDNVATSTSSIDTQASIVTDGGITVKQQLSAKTVRIDNNSGTTGCTLTFDSTKSVLSFVFQ